MRMALQGSKVSIVWLLRFDAMRCGWVLTSLLTAVQDILVSIRCPEYGIESKFRFPANSTIGNVEQKFLEKVPCSANH